jgi:hypothetical protein
MKNQNFIKIKKASEERYFKNHSELFDFVMRSMNITEDRFYDLCKKYKSYEHEVLMPLSVLSSETHRYIRIARFICLLSKGNFTRKSGNYIYNVLAIQKIDNLTGNDLIKIFQ